MKTSQEMDEIKFDRITSGIFDRIVEKIILSSNEHLRAELENVSPDNVDDVSYELTDMILENADFIIKEILRPLNR